MLLKAASQLAGHARWRWALLLRCSAMTNRLGRRISIRQITSPSREVGRPHHVLANPTMHRLCFTAVPVAIAACAFQHLDEELW